MRSSAKYVWWIIFILFVGGFLLLDNSGLLTGSGITPNTVVAEVNGRDILYTTWAERVQLSQNQESERLGRALTLDEMAQVEDRALEELISQHLLNDEYRRRGITVSIDEIADMAQNYPPPQLTQDPALQTEGRFDLQKYRNYLNGPVAAQTGLVTYLDAYYRDEIPRRKLYQQISADVYLPDSRMWELWQDVHDSAQVSFVALTPDLLPDSAVTVSDAEIRAYFGTHKKELERTGRAVVSIVSMPRRVTAADTAAARAKIAELRREILGGAKFEDIAIRESDDTISGPEGGSLGRGGRNRFVPEFEKAAYALRPGEVSAPVMSDFGFHLIKLDERKGDTLALRHILIEIEPSDSATVALDRRADDLQSMAGTATEPSQFDSAAAKLGLTPIRAVVMEGRPLMVAGQYIPSVAAWAFKGAVPGESSELFDSPDGYFLARLDSIQPGGEPTLESVREDIRARLARGKKIQALLPRARELANAASAGTLESAARAQNLDVTQTPMFNRITFVPGLGQGNEAVGAAFALPVGAVSAPVQTEDALFVLRVDRRVNADRDKFEAQKQVQRTILGRSMREERVMNYLRDLRASAKVEDYRKDIDAAARRAST